MFRLIFKKINILLLTLATVSITGCGFHLQGKYEFSPAIQNLAISSVDSYDPFQKQLKDSLRQNGINIRDNNIESNNIAILEVNSPVVSEQIHSYDSKGQISQYRLVSTCSYKLFAADKKVLRENTITRSRTYSVSPNQLLSNANEQQIISEELSLDIINELLRQLSLCC